MAPQRSRGTYLVQLFGAAGEGKRACVGGLSLQGFSCSKYFMVYLTGWSALKQVHFFVVMLYTNRRGILAQNYVVLSVLVITVNTKLWHIVLTKTLVPLRLAEGTVLHPVCGHSALSLLTARRHRHFTLHTDDEASPLSVVSP